jgi:hypothetical protein
MVEKKKKEEVRENRLLKAGLPEIFSPSLCAGDGLAAAAPSLTSIQESRQAGAQLHSGQMIKLSC